uniref:Uncharacterized protein n=1 Tax=Arundo donax TaxID=35708 RepID=A0A0A9ABK6_ARUDO
MGRPIDHPLPLASCPPTPAPCGSTAPQPAAPLLLRFTRA